MAERETTAFAAWLRKELDRRGMTARDLAHALGGQDWLVQAWLDGEGTPTPMQAGRLAAALGVSEAVIAWRSHGPKPRGRGSRGSPAP